MRMCIISHFRAVRCAALALCTVVVSVASLGAAEQRSATLSLPEIQTRNHSAGQAMPSPPHVYMEVIVKACPQVETPFEPINQGHSYDDDKSMSLTERKAYYAKLGCIDVPIPPEWMTQEMTYEGCKGHAGYLASMQFLQQRQDLKNFPAVGYWVCVPHEYPVSGVAGM
jgi:hypothetical protein